MYTVYTIARSRACLPAALASVTNPKANPKAAESNPPLPPWTPPPTTQAADCLMLPMHMQHVQTCSINTESEVLCAFSGSKPNPVTNPVTVLRLQLKYT
jgi:hypothetical protein